MAFKYPNIGNYQVPMVPIIWIGGRSYSTYQIPGHVEIPEELNVLGQAVVKEKLAAGARVANNPTVSLTQIDIKNLRFGFQSSDYFGFLATHGSLERELSPGVAVRGEYPGLANLSTEKGFNRSPYSMMVGVSTMVLTTDGFCLFVHRSHRTAVVPGMRHVGLAEGMLPTDVNNRGSHDPVETVLRGVQEELASEKPGLKKIPVARSQIQLVALGMSYMLLQPDFACIWEAPCNMPTLLAHCAQASGRWENQTAYAVKFDKNSILTELNSGGRTSPHAEFAIWAALKHRNML